MRVLCCIFLITVIQAFAFSQEQTGGVFRGSIPETLLQPARSEAPRYPIDIVIGELGQGSASVYAFSFARSIALGLLSGRMEHQALSSIGSGSRESYLSALGAINPVNFRIGGGRVEADGAVSFLVRFIGRDQGITGEMYVRYVTRQVQGGDGEVTTAGNWVLEDLLLEEAKNHAAESRESMYRVDYYPYERFY